MLQKNKLFVKVLTAFYEREIWKQYVHYFNITLKTFLCQGVGKTAPYLGQDGPLSVFASDSSMIHTYRLFCLMQL